MNAVIGGEGPWMILIHSVGANLTIWEDALPLLQRSFHTLAYDVRGHGGSAAPDGAMTIEDWSEDLLALADALSIDRFSLVGLSMGGMIAQHFAAHQPHRVRALVLMDTACDYEEPARAVWHERAAIAERDGMEPLVEPTIRRWFTTSYIERNPPSLQRIRRAVAAMNPHHYAEGCRALAALHTAPLLPRIFCPTLVVVGEQDIATPPAQSKQIHQTISGSKLITIPDAAHCPVVERPAPVLDAMVEFFKGVAA